MSAPPLARVLLLGAEAEALASRLEASGYRVVDPGLLESDGGHPSDGGGEAEGAPDLVVLAASEQHRIAGLRQRFGATPLLLDGGSDDLEARSRCLGSGADDFWLSALGPSDLLMRLRLHNQLSQRARQPQPLLQVGDLSINPAIREVKRGPRPVSLTAREYQLLLLLMERSGTVVTREQILRQVWNDDQGASSNVIEVYVRYLRQKLEQAGERRLIHTVRGQGYSLSERIPPPVR